MYNTFFTFTLLLLSFVAYSQDYVPLDWGRVDYQDLEMTVYPLDSAAQAVVLGDEGYMNVNIGDDGYFECHLRRHRRIKILNEAAVDRYGDASIYYYHDENKDVVRQIKAQTIAPDGNITEVENKEIYREKINEYWTKISFSFPNVVPGSVVEYRYQHFSKRWVVPSEWTFRERIPVRSSYFTFGCKAPIVYTYLLQGAEFMTSEMLADGRQKLQLEELSLLIDKTSFWMENGQAVEEEPYMTTLEDYYIKVRFQASERMNRDGTSTSVYGSWEDATKRLLAHPNMGEIYLKRRHHKFFLADAIAEIEPSDSQAELVRQITDFIQREIKWSGGRGIFTDGSIEDAYRLHSADLPEIQYAGIALLRHFGLEANPVILSTRDNGAMITSFPFIDQFNYVIILAEVDGRNQLLDFSDPFLNAGNVQLQALNGRGFLLHEETPNWIDLNMPIFQDVLACNGQISENGSIEGKMKCTMRAYSARSDREDMNEQELTAIWADRLPNGAELTELTAEHEKEPNEPLIVTGNFKLTEAGFSNDDFLYVSPLVFSSFLKNPFSREQRTYPINFPYPFEEKTIYSYAIPEGFAIDALPENANLSLPNGDAVFQYMAQEKNGKINILIILRIKKTFYPPHEYEALKSLFEEAAQKIQDQIVLKKT